MNKETAWQALDAIAASARTQHLRELLQDPDRFDQFSFRHDELLLDLSRQRLTVATRSALLELARSCQLEQWIKALFEGAEVNHTEKRPALHTALRQPQQRPFLLNSQDINADVHRELQRMERLVSQLHQQQWRGFSGEPIDTLVNIGVGGSDLGPMMVCHGLEEFQPNQARSIKIHFISSMDGSQISSVLQHLDPERTLFLVSSKSFTTADTLANAATARDWLRQASNMPDTLLLKRHFIGITARPEKAQEWGLAADNLLHFWDWVGGRYSLWSSIGFAIAVRIGMQGFRELLDGAWRMDEHFRHTPWDANLPVLLALTEVWNINFLDIHAHAILPYDGRLAHLPSYLEQLEMESNGKSVDRDGQRVAHRTCPVLWGEIGPNAQHAFYQLLHQGSEAVMCDFIIAANRYDDARESLQAQHRLTLANCLAQARVLALGDEALDQPGSTAWQHYLGNQPSSLILLDKLTPGALGALLALYEHKVFVQSVIWDINPFDQWGVELGKQMANTLLPHIGQAPEQTFDTATDGILRELNHLTTGPKRT